MTTNEMTPADLAAVTGNNNDGFGGNGAWWIIILFLFAFAGGWGNNGFGGNGGGVSDNYVLASDFATLQRQLDSGFSAQERRTDSIINGICSLGYDSLAQSNQTNMAIMQNGYDTRSAIAGIGSQMAQCCCDIREGISGVNYNLATQGCATQNAINTSARDIVDNQNANTRAILDALNAQATEALKTRIAEQSQQISALQLASSQAAQNEYIISRLQPCPVPSFPASNLYGYYNCGGCGCNS